MHSGPVLYHISPDRRCAVPFALQHNAPLFLYSSIQVRVDAAKSPQCPSIATRPLLCFTVSDRCSSVSFHAGPLQFVTGRFFASPPRIRSGRRFALPFRISACLRYSSAKLISRHIASPPLVRSILASALPLRGRSSLRFTVACRSIAVLYRFCAIQYQALARRFDTFLFRCLFMAVRCFSVPRRLSAYPFGARPGRC